GDEEALGDGKAAEGVKRKQAVLPAAAGVAAPGPAGLNPRQVRRLQERLKTLQATDAKRAARLMARLRAQGNASTRSAGTRAPGLGPAPAAGPGSVPGAAPAAAPVTTPGTAAVVPTVPPKKKARRADGPITAEYNPAANYYVVSKDPLDVTSATSQIFLGV